MKKGHLVLFFIPAFIFQSCLLTNTAVDPDALRKNLCVKDQSHIGLLNFCNFEGSVENKNSFSVTNIGLKGTIYNKTTKERSVYEFKITVPITSYGVATYKEKIYVGKNTSLEKVEIVCAERY